MSAGDDDDPLVEIPLPQAGPRAWLRLKAGFLVEAGRADGKLTKRWQALARAGEFDADRAAGELFASDPTPDEDPQLLARAGRLALDLWMAPTLAGARGAARGARETGRSCLAALVAQSLILLTFLGMFAIGLLLLRYLGHEVQAPLDRTLEALGLAPGGAGS